MRFVEHPQRQQVVGEMHLRRFPLLTLPAQAIQIVHMLEDDDRAREKEALAALSCPCRSDGARHLEARWSDDARITWEGHSEAGTATLTLTGPDALPLDWRLPDEGPAAGALRWIERLPGQAIRATHVIMVDDEASAKPIVAAAEFSPSHLVSCHVSGGARIWSDFRIHADGYGRLVIAANGLSSGDLARCVQKLQELGNYRNMALTGLPVAQNGWSQLAGIGESLEQTGRALQDGQGRDDDLLAALTTQSATLLSIASACDFRMSATAAYARIVSDRLAELDVRPIAGFQSLSDFTSRRFNPAMRTCAAFADRLALLSGRAAQFTGLLRTRIETHIENQNARLLTSMDASARMQLRLQHLVEGLSVVAISYYALGLLSYPLKAVEKIAPALSSTLALGVAVPIVLMTVSALMGRMRRKLISTDDNHP